MHALPAPNQQSDLKPNYSPALSLMTAFPMAQANTSPNYCTFPPKIALEMSIICSGLRKKQRLEKLSKLPSLAIECRRRVGASSRLGWCQKVSFQGHWSGPCRHLTSFSVEERDINIVGAGCRKGWQELWGRGAEGAVSDAEVLHLTVSVHFPRLLPLGHILAEEVRRGG